MRRSVLFLVGSLMLSHFAWAYKEETHEDMSEQAVEASVLAKDQRALPNLGLQSLGSKQNFPDSNDSGKTIVNLFRFGSRFEDDGSRAINHFFDPTRNQPLRPYGIPLVINYTSPTWTLEDRADIVDQEYSYKNARQYFYDALTKSDRAERDKNFGLTFQTLGQVIHHLQDMAQPQHVRNDAHLDRPQEFDFLGTKIPNPAYNPSLYEDYTRKLGANLPLGTHPAVRFTKPRDFWATANGAGRGLAEYTNANFVSAGTNFSLDEEGQALPNARYPSPRPSGVWESLPIETLFAERGEPVPCTTNAQGIRECLSGVIDFYWTDVRDWYLGITDINKRAASLSIFDQDLQRYNTPVININDPDDPTDDTIEYRTFTLNRFNFDEAHKFLIPRAVAYSAGLIDYFFRGRIDLDLGVGPAAYVIKNYGDEDMQGTFAVYYDAVDGTRHLVPGTGAETAWDGISIPAKSATGAGRSAALTFATPTDPPPAQSGEYVLVFRGRLGQEADAVVGRVINEYVYVLDGNGYVTRVSIYGGQSVNYPIPRPTRDYIPTGLSVYDTTFFYNVNDGSFRSQAPGMAMRYRSDGSSSVITQTGLGNGTAVNSDRVYVTDLGDGNGAVEIKTFTHSDTPVGTFLANPNYRFFGGSVDIAANESHVATTHNEHLYIYTREGSLAATVTGLSIFSQEVAMNRDSSYVLDGGNVGIYTPLGMLREYVDLGPTNGFYIDAIDVTDDRLYVVTTSDFRTPAYQLHVYERQVERDAAGGLTTERFNYQRAVPFSLSARWYPLGISADRARLSRQPTQQ